MSRGSNSLLERLCREFPGVDTTEYISFYAIRNYGYLNSQPVTSQIYVHSKLLIVDDRIAVIGSANINDRSMVGQRDSEIAVVVRDRYLLASKMDGRDYAVGRFASSLRLSLWKEHLSLVGKEVPQLIDPICSHTYRQIWMNTAIRNTKIYCSVFPFIEDLLRDLKSFSECKQNQVNNITALSQVQGHLVLYPFDFLADMSLNINFTNPELFAGNSVFQ